MLQASLNNLSHDISLLQLHVQNVQDAGFGDMTRLLESLSIKLFGAAFDLSLKNKNLFSPNFPAIDLADDSKKVAVQVTTTANTQKVRHTIEQFEKNGIATNYNVLYIFGFLKCTKVKNLPTYCQLIRVGDLISALTDKNDEDSVQVVIDAVKQHTDFSRLHPYDDIKCLEIVLGVIDRNAIKHRMCCEGSHSEMVKGLNEITQVISKGTIGKKSKCKCVDEFQNEGIKSALRKIRNEIGEILAIVNAARIEGADFYNIEWDGMRKIDGLKMSIIDQCNILARKHNIALKLFPI